jgi:Mrp family chromosome partitioning ATPase
VPVLAALPSLRGKRYHLLRLRKKQDHSDRSAIRDAEGIDIELDQVASSMRAMLTTLYGNNRSSPGRTVLISSAGAEEGKTTVALNLAIEAARRGNKVLLVDADFNGHTLSKNPAATAGAGLFDLLEGRVKLSSVLLNHSDAGLQFVPCGNATRVESRQPMPDLIVQRLVEPARNFGLVVIDSGAVLVDSCVGSFADVVDDIVFVVRAGASKKEDILSALAALRLSSRKIRGTVLTSVEGNLG